MKLCRSTFFILFISGLHVGCTVGKLSPPLDITRNRELKDALKQVVLGIADTNSPQAQTTARQLQNSLQQSGLFRKAAIVSDLRDRPDLVLDSYENTRFGFPVGFQCFEPYLLVLSIGIIPQTCESDIDVSFRLHRPSGRVLSFGHQRFKEKSVSGWVALPLSISPQWRTERSSQRDLWISVFQSRQSEILSILR
jgi:hypothetical protein